MSRFTRQLKIAASFTVILLVAGCASSGSVKDDASAAGSACPAHLKLTCEKFPGQKERCYCSSREDVRAFLWLGREWHRN